MTVALIFARSRSNFLRILELTQTPFRRLRQEFLAPRLVETGSAGTLDWFQITRNDTDCGTMAHPADFFMRFARWTPNRHPK